MSTAAKSVGTGAVGTSFRMAPLIVRSRTKPIAVTLLIGVGIGLLMALIRRGGDLDVEEWLLSAGGLVLGFWLAAQAGGLFLRRGIAGHAMRFDHAGIHHPGWGVVPWDAVGELSLRRLGGSETKSVWSLVVDIDPRCPGPLQGGYVRWLFGPIEGLRRRSRPIEIPLVAIDAEPQELLVSIQQYRAAARTAA